MTPTAGRPIRTGDPQRRIIQVAAFAGMPMITRVKRIKRRRIVRDWLMLVTKRITQ
jgi:hypothetical protein